MTKSLPKKTSPAPSPHAGEHKAHDAAYEMNRLGAVKRTRLKQNNLGSRVDKGVRAARSGKK